MCKIVIPMNSHGEVDTQRLDQTVDWSQPSEVERVIFSVGEPDPEKLIGEVREQPSLARIAWSGGHTLLHVAATNRMCELAQVLVRNGAEVDCFDGFSYPIHEAAEGVYPSADIVEILIDGGANINARDRNGATPLHLTARSGNVVVTKLLLAHGASIDIRDSDGDYALDVALRNKRQEAAKLISGNEG